MEKKIVLIVGAGPAGLTAAWELLKKGPEYQPIIVEKDSQVGGISKTVLYNGNRIDIGGHRFFTKNDAVKEIWHEVLASQSAPSADEILLNTSQQYKADGKDPEKDDCVMLRRHRISRIFAFGKFFNYPITINPQTFINLGLKRTLNAALGYLLTFTNRKEPNSLEDFYIKRFGRGLYHAFFEKYTEKVWGIHPRELSAAWGSQRVKELSIKRLIAEALAKTFTKNFKTKTTSLIESFEYPKFGPGSLYEEMARKIINNGGEILLNTEVVGLDLSEDYFSIQIKDKDEHAKTIYSSAIFSSMPLKELIAMLQAPKDIQEIAANLPYRDFITVGLLLNKLKIKNNTKIKTINNIIPDNWIYIQDDRVKLGRLQVFNNWSPYMVKDFKNKIWLGLEYFCNVSDELWQKSDDEFINFAKDELEKIGFIDKAEVLDATVIKVQKAYPAYFGSYDKINEVKDYLNTIPNLYCIGRNGQHHYNNMDHSMLTAIEAVKLFLSEKKLDKSTLWNINTESSYHETTTS